MTPLEFAEFICGARPRSGPRGGVTPQYGVVVPSEIVPLAAKDPDIRITNLGLAFPRGDGEIRFEFEVTARGLQLSTSPPFGLTIDMDAVDERFFSAPLRHAADLADILSRGGRVKGNGESHGHLHLVDAGYWLGGRRTNVAPPSDSGEASSDQLEHFARPLRRPWRFSGLSGQLRAADRYMCVTFGALPIDSAKI